MPDEILLGDGKMGTLIAERDWSNHVLGPVAEWPDQLRSAVAFCLHSPMPVAVFWGKDLSIIYNDAWSSILGDKHPEALGQKAGDVWSELWHIVGPSIQKSIKTGEGVFTQYEMLPMFRRGYIEEAYFHYAFTPLLGKTKQVNGLTVIANEVTKRLLIERRNGVLRNLSLYSVAAESAEAAAILAANVLGEAPEDIPFAKIYLMNDTVDSLRLVADTTIENDEIRQQDIILDDDKGLLPYRTVINSRRPQVIYNFDRQLNLDGGPWPETCRHLVMLPMIRPQTNELFGMVIAGISPRLFYDDAYEQFLIQATGLVTLSVGLAHDIAVNLRLEQRQRLIRSRYERELAESQQKYDALFNSNIISILVARVNGTILEANDTFLSNFGYARSELLDLTLSSIMPAGSRHKLKQFYDSLKHHGEVEPLESSHVRKNGSIISTVVGGVMIPGSKDRFVAFILDVSEQQRLKDLNESKDEFISIASHQLRTPATAVKQYLGMIIEGYAGTVSKDQQRIITTAYESNQRQLAIVNDILRVAQADARELALQKKNTDIIGIINEVISEQIPKLENRSQEIKLQSTREKMTIEADELQMRIVFENLIDNASKYSSRGTRIDILLRRSKGMVIIDIVDQGVGIRQRDIGRLFQKFSRLDNPLSTSAGGTGLGLYLVQKIIELHDGTIGVQSKLGKGTTFTIKLPIFS